MLTNCNTSKSGLDITPPILSIASHCDAQTHLIAACCQESIQLWAPSAWHILHIVHKLCCTAHVRHRRCKADDWCAPRHRISQWAGRSNVVGWQLCALCFATKLSTPISQLTAQLKFAGSLISRTNGDKLPDDGSAATAAATYVVQHRLVARCTVGCPWRRDALPN